MFYFLLWQVVDKVVGIQQGEACCQAERFQPLAEEALSVCLCKGSQQGEPNGNGLNEGQEEKGSTCNGPAASASLFSQASAYRM